MAQEAVCWYEQAEMEGKKQTVTSETESGIF